MLDQATHDHGRWCAEVVEALGLLGDGGEDGSGSDQSGGAAGSDTAAVAEEEPGGAAPDAAAAGAEAAAGAAAPAAQPPRPAAPLHVGVSVGGAMLLDMALVRPEAIAGAALLAPGCLHPGVAGVLAIASRAGQPQLCLCVIVPACPTVRSSCKQSESRQHWAFPLLSSRDWPSMPRL